MHFGTNKLPVEVIKEGAFGGTYFRDIYSGITETWYKKSRKELDELKDIDQKYYCWNYYDVSFNKYSVKCGALLRFWKSNGWINPRDVYWRFQSYFRYWLGWYSSEDESQINRWKEIVIRFKG